MPPGACAAMPGSPLSDESDYDSERILELRASDKPVICGVVEGNANISLLLFFLVSPFFGWLGYMPLRPFLCQQNISFCVFFSANISFLQDFMDGHGTQISGLNYSAA